MRSLQLRTALTEFVEAAAAHLQANVAAGAEVSFELQSQRGRGRSGGTELYCYRALTGEFIAAREQALARLPSHAPAAALLGSFDGLDRYLAGMGLDLARAGRPVRVNGALGALLRDVFAEQTDFELRPERLEAALSRLESSALESTSDVTLVATLQGLTITSPELPLTKGLTIARADALEGLPEAPPSLAEAGDGERLVVVLAADGEDPRAAIARGRAVLADLLRALRLFGDGRVTLDALGWVRVGRGAWTPLVAGSGGRPHGMLVVTAEQEDELRAFCNLVSRRSPHGNELAWALRRFELGCERDSAYEALSDHLLALRTLLEPEGSASGMLPARLSALCAVAGQREALRERVCEALALERSVISGTAVEHAGGQLLAGEIADHLRALLRDVICGHLSPHLAALADEILLAPEAPSGEQVAGDEGQAPEVLDVLI